MRDTIADIDIVVATRAPDPVMEALVGLPQVARVLSRGATLSSVLLGVSGVQCDVREPESIRAVVDRTKDELGSIDILVNNAGTSWGAPVTEYPIEGWRKVIDVNLTGLFLFAQAAGREMIAQGRGGRIVNIASVAAFRGAPPELMDAIAYNTSKGGVVSFTRDLAAKWAR